jgi:hypothetical protein
MGAKKDSTQIKNEGKINRVTYSSKRTLNEDAYLGIVPTPPSPIILLLSLSRPPILRANPKYPKRQTC